MNNIDPDILWINPVRAMGYTLKMTYFLGYIGIVVLHVAVSQVNSERGKSAQNERRSFHGTAIIAPLF